MASIIGKRSHMRPAPAKRTPVAPDHGAKVSAKSAPAIPSGLTAPKSAPDLRQLADYLCLAVESARAVMIPARLADVARIDQLLRSADPRLSADFAGMLPRNGAAWADYIEGVKTEPTAIAFRRARAKCAADSLK